GIFNLSPHFPGHLFYTTLYQSPSGVLWAGTWRDGVFYYDPDQKEGGSFKSTSKEGSLPSNRINRIFEDSEKRIWIATEGGLSKHHFSSKTFKNYTTEEGLPSNLIFSFLEDKKNNIWISTSK